MVHGLTGKYHNHGPFSKGRATIIKTERHSLPNDRGRPNQLEYINAARRLGYNISPLHPPGALSPQTWVNPHNLLQQRKRMSAPSSIPIGSAGPSRLNPIPIRSEPSMDGSSVSQAPCQPRQSIGFNNVGSGQREMMARAKSNPIPGANNSLNGNNPSDDDYNEDEEDDADDVFLLSQRMIQYLNPDIAIDVKSEPISDDDTAKPVD